MVIRVAARGLLLLFLLQDGAKTTPFTIEIKNGTVPKTLRGKLLTPGGATAETLTISSGWFWESNGKTPYEAWEKGPREIRNGCVELRFDGEPGALFAFDEKNRMGAVQVLKGRPPDQDIILDVKPLVEVRGELVCKNTPPAWAKAEVSAVSPDGRAAPVASYYFEDGSGKSVRLLLPPGAYRVLFKGTGAQHRTVPLAIDGKEKVLDLKRIDLPARSIEGGVIPKTWKVTAARGVGKDVALADYRGKWVLLEFWGYW